MNAGQIIVITLIIGGVILWNWVGRDAKREEAERKAKQAESDRKKREEEARKHAAWKARMRVYEDEYDEYIKRADNSIYPAGRPLSFDQWREFFEKY